MYVRPCRLKPCRDNPMNMMRMICLFVNSEKKVLVFIVFLVLIYKFISMLRSRLHSSKWPNNIIITLLYKRSLEYVVAITRKHGFTLLFFIKNLCIAKYWEFFTWI